MAIRQKSVIQMKLDGTGETHARSKIRARDVESTIDEPLARDGTNQGLTPTETLMASLIGCTNVITKRIAHQMGVEMGEMTVSLTADFDRRGVSLQDEIDHPFSNIVMDIKVATDATADQMDHISRDLARFCPIAKVIRGSGVTITENWTQKSL
ncbi:MAG: OsmC family protein [Silicimonas sp.]|nr:OsmC family protein [Silicimonas sp.]